MGIAPDLKDRTWVVDRPCGECGFDPRSGISARPRRTVPPWLAVLARTDVAVRPAPSVWSPLEYACHVRDVYGLFEGRLRLLLTARDPQFANWDQDATAVEHAYGRQDPATVAAELSAAGARIARAFASVPDDAWARPGRRSNSSRFTVESLGRCFLHDVVHHLHDVGAGGQPDVSS